MTRHIGITMAFLVLCFSIAHADTFTHRSSGEVFNGFATQKSTGARTLVYVEDEKKFKPLNLAEYDITYNAKGRRNNVALVQINRAEVMSSQVISSTIAEGIKNASNKGPRFILVEIDSPGGRGDYMKQIASAIADTDNCRTVAFINGGKFGGAHSAAAALAMAADKVYMAPGTSMSAVAPIVGRALTDEQLADHTRTYNAPSLSAYKSYIAALAEKNNRPSVMAMAMLDKSIEVVEVTGGKGTQTFIERTRKLPSQAVVKTWSKPAAGKAAIAKAASMSLTPADAVYCGMADKLSASRAELLADMNTADARLMRIGDTDKLVAKFLAAKRNLSKFMASIDYLQTQADDLEKQWREIEQKNRQLADTRKEYFDASRATATRKTYSDDLVLSPYGISRRHSRQMEREGVDAFIRGLDVESTDPVDTTELLDELSFVLADLIRDYLKALRLARRYPGALPFGLNLQSLETKLESARTLSDDIRWR